MYLTLLELVLLVIVAYTVGLLTSAVVGYYAAKLTLRMTGKSEHVMRKPLPLAKQAGQPLYPMIVDDEGRIMTEATIAAAHVKTPTQSGKPKT